MKHKVSPLLDALQQALERAGYWQAVPPSPEKLMSAEPFSIDTLSFTEWLQWIYIARLRALLEAGRSLPRGALVAPYAEESLRHDGVRALPILELIRQLDDCLSA